MNEDAPPGWERDWWCWECLSEKSAEKVREARESSKR